MKCDQDKDEQLQRFRNAMPQGSWWTEQVKTIDSAWKILDTEFADRRKLMDELLSEINNLRPVKGDAKSFAHFATTIACYVDDMEMGVLCYSPQKHRSLCPNFCPNFIQRTIQILAEK